MPNRPIKLLLADDSVVIQKLVGLSFANEDIEIITVDNGDAAVSQASSSQPDIVLADVVMPGKNGYEVCSEIRSNPELANTPVLLLTGTFEAFDEGRASEAGATGHITKPFEAQALVDRVNAILAEGSGPAATAPQGEAGGDFFDNDPGDLSSEASAEQANPLAVPAASPEAPSQAIDFDFSESGLARSQQPAALPAQPTGEIDDGLGIETPHEPGVGEQTVAILPENEPPAGEAWAPDPIATATPGESVGAAAPDQTMLIDDATPAESPEAWPQPYAPHTIGSVELTSATAPSPLGAIDSPMPADNLDLGELSFDDSIPVDATSPLPMSPPGETETAIADDLFGPARETGDALDASLPPSPAGAHPTPTAPLAADPPAPSSSQGLDIDFGAPATTDPVLPSSASHYDVSASDLQVEPLAGDASWGHGVPAGVVTGPDPIMPPHDVAPPPRPSHVDAGDPTAGFDGDWEAPLAGGLSSEPQAPPALGFETPTQPASGAASSQTTDLSPDMRDRIHDTLEKVAWEAFSDLSDDLVKQLVDRVEQIAWEVIPQMAETLITEEIRKMKGEEGDGDAES